MLGENEDDTEGKTMRPSIKEQSEGTPVRCFPPQQKKWSFFCFNQE